MKTNRFFLISTALTILATSATTALGAETANRKKWSPQVEVETKFGTNGRNIIVPKVMTPLWQNEKSMVFTDFRYKMDDQDSQELNIGAGYRTLLKPNLIVGGYGFFDRLRSDQENTYLQGTLGLEALTVENDVRMNVYIPESAQNAAPGAGKLVINGGQLSIKGGMERALPGFDLEIGQKLPVSFADVRVYGGGYHFGADGYESLTGPRGRIEMTLDEAQIPAMPLGAEVTLGGEVQHDGVRGTEAYALLELKIPFGGNDNKLSLSPIEQRMNKFIERDVDIVSGTGGTEAARINGGDVTNFVHIDSSSNFVDTVNNAAEKTLILVDGSNGTINSGAGTAVMKAGQVITGGGATISVVGAKSGIRLNHTFEGTSPTIDATGSGSNLIDLADSTTLKGLTVTNMAGSGIVGSNIDRITISDVTIENAGNYGVNFDGTDNNDFTVNNLTINNVANDGFNIDQGNNINITDLSVTDAADEGIELSNVTNLVLNNAISTNSGDYGIAFGSINSLTMNNATVNGTTADGIIFFGTNSDINVSGARVTNAGMDGFEVAGVTGLSLVDTIITGSGGSGMHIAGTSTDITIQNATINNSQAYGLDFDGMVTDVNVSDVTIDTATTGDGFNIDLGDSINVTNLSVTGAGDDGIEFNNVTNIILADATSNNSGGDGIVFDGSDHVTATNLAVDTTGARGLIIVGASDIQINDIIVADTTDHGISVQSGSSDVTIADGSVTNAGVEGILIDTVAGLNLSGITVTNSFDDAIELTGTNSDIAISDMDIIDNIAGDGIDVEGNVAILSFTNININNVGPGGTAYGYEFDGSTITGLSGSGNTNTGQAGGGNCSTIGATITGSFVYNNNQTCP